MIRNYRFLLTFFGCFGTIIMDLCDGWKYQAEDFQSMIKLIEGDEIMDTVKIKNYLKMIINVIPVAAFFCIWQFLEYRQIGTSEMSTLLLGITLVTAFFSVFMRKFDFKKTVSRYWVLLGITLAVDLAFYFGIRNYKIPEIYEVIMCCVFKSVELALLFVSYREFVRIKTWIIVALVAVSIICDALSFFYPQFALAGIVTMAVVGIVTYIVVWQEVTECPEVSGWVHLLFFLGMIIRMDGVNYTVSAFGGMTAAFAIRICLYMYRIIKLHNDELKHEKKKLDFKSEEMNVMLSQIKPHFIYNTLNTIQYLCRTDGELAADTISDFSDYLRTNLNFDTNRQVVPFSEELEHVNKYLKIEKLRFRHRLMVKYDVTETDFCVPTLSLQPIIENSVKHGISKRLNGGTITISTYIEDDNYVVQIKDNGVGFTEKEREEKENDAKRKSLGLKNISNRIENLLDGRLEIVSRKERGTTARIILPIARNLEEMENESSVY